jgi:formate dehydrogenase iron-sulfur subunit
MMEKKAVLIDIYRCVGCEMCKWACKEANDLPDTDDKELSPNSFTVIKEKNGYYVRRQCMHCEDPACLSACPVHAFRKVDQGPVLYDAYKCMGCRYCMLACPFEVPTYEWDKRLPKVSKCIFCAHRLEEGGIPACVEACPFEATEFGDRDEIIEIAKQRIADNPDTYVDHIYGLEEVGGTSFIYISPVPFEELGFRTNLTTDPMAQLTWKALKKVPDVVLLGGATLYGIYWITSRRDEVAKFEKKGQNKDYVDLNDTE